MIKLFIKKGSTLGELICAKRYTQNNYYKEDIGNDFRSAFMADYDRVIFSNPFRRLSKKTQVHPLSQNDHIHNRLTHSLEVASVGRTLGIGVGKKLEKDGTLGNFTYHDVASILQSACLAHDIGNPPFGHAGEEVIKSWFKDKKENIFLKELKTKQLSDFLSFDGNAQSIRVVTKLENHKFDGGMRLTLTTLATMIKYPWNSSFELSGGKKFSFFESEKDIQNLLFNEFGICETYRHPFSYLLEAADDICYSLLDVKDAIELGTLKLTEMEEIFTLLCPNSYDDTVNHKQMSELEKTSRLCAKAINNLCLHVIEIFQINTLRDIKDLTQLFKDKNLKTGLLKAKKLGYSFIFNEKRKTRLELGAYNIIGTLLDNFIATAYALHKKTTSFKDGRILTLMGDEAPKEEQSLYEKYQAVLDYIVGMTDNYATDLAKELRGF